MIVRMIDMGDVLFSQTELRLMKDRLEVALLGAESGAGKQVVDFSDLIDTPEKARYMDQLAQSIMAGHTG